MKKGRVLLEKAPAKRVLLTLQNILEIALDKRQSFVARIGSCYFLYLYHDILIDIGGKCSSRMLQLRVSRS